MLVRAASLRTPPDKSPSARRQGGGDHRIARIASPGVWILGERQAKAAARGALLNSPVQHEETLAVADDAGLHHLTIVPVARIARYQHRVAFGELGDHRALDIEFDQRLGADRPGKANALALEGVHAGVEH